MVIDIKTQHRTKLKNLKLIKKTILTFMYIYYINNNKLL